MYFTIQNRINYFKSFLSPICTASLIENKEDIMIKLIALDMDGTLLNEKKSWNKQRLTLFVKLLKLVSQWFYAQDVL